MSTVYVIYDSVPNAEKGGYETIVIGVVDSQDIAETVCSEKRFRVYDSFVLNVIETED